jgi:Leu/Phe-tRNA-protein transferase
MAGSVIDNVYNLKSEVEGCAISTRETRKSKQTWISDKGNTPYQTLANNSTISARLNSVRSDKK